MTVIKNLELALQDALALHRPLAEVQEIRRGLAAYRSFEVMKGLRDATASARGADIHIGTRAQAGLVQVVRAVPTAEGRFDVTPLSDWMHAEQAVAALLDIAAKKAAPRRFTGEPPSGFGGL